MADIRINALPTTATDFASDDYIAIDGTTNGTRKLNAKTANLTFSDVTLGTSGPSVKSTLSARAPRQGLVFDGTSGGTIANVATIGTADFTIAVWMNLRSTAGSQFILTNSTGTSNFQTSATDLVMYRSTGSTIATSTSPLVANKTQLIVYTRSGTTGQFYVNGVAFEGTKTDANSYTTFSNIGGVGSSSPCNGTLIPYIYNRALSASEVVALYEAGAPAGADYNSASNTSLLTGANSDFSSAGNWNVTGSTTISGGKLNLSTGDAAWNALALLSKGKRYRLTITVDSITAGIVEYYNGSSYVTFASTAGTYTVEFTCAATFSPGLHLRSSGGNAVLDTALYYPLGLLLAPDAAQAGGGLTWYDTSGNAANITLPASGVSWNVPTSASFAGGWSFGSGGGNVGIGLTNPTAGQLHVQGNSDAASGPNRPRIAITNQAGTAQTWTIQSWQSSGDANLSIYRTAAAGGILLASTGGRVGVGVTSFSGSGALELATHTTSAGGIGFGTDVSVYRDTNSTLNGTAPGGYALTRTGINGVGLATGVNVASDAKTANDAIGISLSLQNSSSATKTYGQIYAEINSATASSENGSLVLRTIKAGTLTTALTLDSSQRCILSGALRLNNAYVSGAPTATGYVTIQDSAGNTYKVLVGT